MTRQQRVRSRLLLTATLAAALVVAAQHRHEWLPRPLRSRRELELRAMLRQLEPLHRRLDTAHGSDWLAQHNEAGQGFGEYLDSHPVTLTPARHALCVQPLGALSATQRAVVREAAEFMALYFHTEARVCEGLPLERVPSSAVRAARGFGLQMHTQPLLDLLRQRLPSDAAAYVAFTASDLYPQPSWNFVLGQASLTDRVGVWSLARFGRPDASPSARRRCLLRTIKVATHETGHMFSLPHCTAYECNMNGANSLEESDRSPLALCPQCQAKLAWATGAQPAAQFGPLADWCARHGLAAEAGCFRRSQRALQALD